MKMKAMAIGDAVYGTIADAKIDSIDQIRSEMPSIAEYDLTETRNDGL